MGSAEQCNVKNPGHDDNERQTGEHHEAQSAEPAGEWRRVEDAVLTRNDGEAVVEVEKIDDRGNKQGQRRGHEHQPDRPRHPGDDHDRRDQ